MFDNEQKVEVWALRPCQLYIACIYLLSWPIKLVSSEIWRHGFIVYYSDMLSNYARWPGGNLFVWGNGFLSKVLTYYTLFIELAFPLLVWFRKYRLACVLGALFLQIGLTVLLEGVCMFTSSFAIGLILFLPSKRTRLFFRKLLYSS